MLTTEEVEDGVKYLKEEVENNLKNADNDRIVDLYNSWVDLDTYLFRTKRHSGSTASDSFFCKVLCLEKLEERRVKYKLMYRIQKSNELQLMEHFISETKRMYNIEISDKKNIGSLRKNVYLSIQGNQLLR